MVCFELFQDWVGVVNYGIVIWMASDRLFWLLVDPEAPLLRLANVKELHLYHGLLFFILDNLDGSGGVFSQTILYQWLQLSYLLLDVSFLLFEAGRGVHLQLVHVAAHWVERALNPEPWQLVYLRFHDLGDARKDQEYVLDIDGFIQKWVNCIILELYSQLLLLFFLLRHHCSTSSQLPIFFTFVER